MRNQGDLRIDEFDGHNCMERTMMFGAKGAAVGKCSFLNTLGNVVLKMINRCGNLSKTLNGKMTDNH